MRPLTLPTLHWQQRSQLSEDSIHSLLIALLRGMAALQVAAAHLRAEVFPSLRSVTEPPLYYLGLAFITGFAHQAVVVFFLVSGWLVGGSLLNKLNQPQALRSYAIDRATRLWTVLVPAMVVMVGVGIITGALNPAAMGLGADNDFSVLSFAGNLVGLQTVLVKNFGGNYALWSLANETWYYVAFPLLLLAFRGPGLWRQAASVAALALIASLLPWAITLYFALWLLGALFSRIRIDCAPFWRYALVAIAGALSIYYRITGSNDDLVPASFVQDLVCSLPFLLLLSTLQIKIDHASRPLRRLRAFAQFFSEFSFTLYVIHVPTIILLRFLGRAAFGRDQLAPDKPLDYAIYAGMVVLIVGVAYLSYLMFESQTYRVRASAKRLLLTPPAKQAQAPAMSPE
ncbi:acyltransferase [Massilia agilis]|uniref:Acyltransferase n=1 Tax=Massilia agilis TaxID=1811226 RepID=A0ABT2D9W2_9BURK|nr:acyltransferase [Massilia agilis]MCS0808095.1 acyltransferase [Massilia agilis]